jgi:hypothetical protein
VLGPTRAAGAGVYDADDDRLALRSGELEKVAALRLPGPLDTTNRRQLWKSGQFDNLKN